MEWLRLEGTGKDVEWEEGEGLVQAVVPKQQSGLGHAFLARMEAGCFLKGPQGLICACVVLPGKKLLFIVRLSQPCSSQDKANPLSSLWGGR